MREKNTILVTGGCGYIGSHICAQLSRDSSKVLVLDNLSTGRQEALLHGEQLVVGDFGDRALLRQLFAEHKIHTIFHFAASIAVEESVRDPFSYYENNSIKFFTLLQEAHRAQIPHFILSSTAAVYGMQEGLSVVREDSPLRPASPYGRSKVFDEWILEDVAKTCSLRYVILRYFNVAGASPNGKLGQVGKGTHLMKVLCETALRLREKLTIYGTDYSTIDGTCIRDYIHVEDLASAHIAALKYLQKGSPSITLNCGYSKGYSVREVIRMFQTITQSSLPIEEGPRREGDVPCLIADSQRISKTLDWEVQHNDLAHILASTWEWEKKQKATISPML